MTDYQYGGITFRINDRGSQSDVPKMILTTARGRLRFVDLDEAALLRIAREALEAHENLRNRRIRATKTSAP